MQWFEKFEIGSWWNKKVEELSKGMAQKVQFITTVLHKPKILILDEPFSGFDPINANLIKSEIMQNTLFLSWLWHIQSLHSGIISIRGARKTWTWKLSPSSPPQITENQKIVSKVCSRRLPKSVQKSSKTDIWPSV